MGKLIKKSIKLSTFGKVDLDKKKPPAKSPRVMPTPDDAEILLAKKRRIAEQQKRSGRVSTILSGDNAGGGFGG